MLKHRVSEVVAEQERLQWIVVEHMSSTSWPPELGEKTEWKPTLYPEDQEDRVIELEQIEKEALQKWNLSDLTLDTIGVAIALDPECESFLKDDLGYKNHDRFYFLGEIVRGHIIVVDSNQPANVYTMIHSFNFYLVPYGEI